MKNQAMFYKSIGDGNVVCHACYKDCHIAEGKAGFCKVRVNEGGVLKTANFCTDDNGNLYGRAAAVMVDPIEKKPLYHFEIGSEVLSMGTPGCNFGCMFCQNFELSQTPVEGKLTDIYPDRMIEYAVSAGCSGIAYTYTEPTIWVEFILLMAAKAKEAGLKNIMVTNGGMSPEVLQELLPLIDAFNVDLKAFSYSFYKTICLAELQPVIDNIRRINIAGKHIEISHVLIPNGTDNADEIRSMAGLVAMINPGIPMHIAKFKPHYKMQNREETPDDTIRMAHALMSESLNYVYADDIDELRTTLCPDCRKPLISRVGYESIVHLSEGKCTNCNSIRFANTFSNWRDK